MSDDYRYEKSTSIGVIFPIDTMGMIGILAVIAVIGSGFFAAIKWIIGNFFALIAGFLAVLTVIACIQEIIAYSNSKKVIKRYSFGSSESSIINGIKMTSMKQLGKYLIVEVIFMVSMLLFVLLFRFVLGLN